MNYNTKRDANAASNGGGALMPALSETFDDARNLVRDALKRRNHWKTLDGLASVAESYVRADVYIHLHLRFNKFHALHQSPARLPVGEIERVDSALARDVRRHIAHPTDLCAHVKLCPSIEMGSPAQAGEFPRGSAWGENGEQAMFVGIIQLLKAKKGVTPTPVPSLVWLKRLDLCPKSFGHIGKLPSGGATLPEGVDRNTTLSDSSLAFQADGEIGSVFSALCGGATDLPSQPVEGRTQIVSNLPDAKGPIDWELFRPGKNSKAVMVGLSVVLGYADFVEVIPEEPLKTTLESYDLAVSPIDSLTWPSEHGGVNSDYGRQEDTEDPEGLRDTDTEAGRLRRHPGQDSEAREALNSEAPPDQVAPQGVSRAQGAGCTAKRTHSGSLEDA